MVQALVSEAEFRRMIAGRTHRRRADITAYALLRLAGLTAGGRVAPRRLRDALARLDRRAGHADDGVRREARARSRRRVPARRPVVPTAS